MCRYWKKNTAKGSLLMATWKKQNKNKQQQHRYDDDSRVLVPYHLCNASRSAIIVYSCCCFFCYLPNQSSGRRGGRERWSNSFRSYFPNACRKMFAPWSANFGRSPTVFHHLLILFFLKKNKRKTRFFPLCIASEAGLVGSVCLPWCRSKSVAYEKLTIFTASRPHSLSRPPIVPTHLDHPCILTTCDADRVCAVCVMYSNAFILPSQPSLPPIVMRHKKFCRRPTLIHHLIYLDHPSWPPRILTTHGSWPRILTTKHFMTSSWPLVMQTDVGLDTTASDALGSHNGVVKTHWVVNMYGQYRGQDR